MKLKAFDLELFRFIVYELFRFDVYDLFKSYLELLPPPPKKLKELF